MEAARKRFDIVRDNKLGARLGRFKGRDGIGKGQAGLYGAGGEGERGRGEKKGVAGKGVRVNNEAAVKSKQVSNHATGAAHKAER